MQTAALQTNTKLRQYLPLVAALVSLLLAYWIGLWCIAELFAIGPRAQIDYWEKQPAEITEPQWRQAQQRLTKAIRLNSSNAEYYWLNGRLALLSQELRLQSSQQPQNTLNNTSAIESLIKAVERRPSWGLAWTYLASAFAINPTHQSKFFTALHNAASLEPYEEINQQKLIPLALANWHQLPEQSQREIQSMIIHALEYNERGIFVLETAAQYNVAEVVEPLITKQWQKDRLNKLMWQQGSPF